MIEIKISNAHTCIHRVVNKTQTKHVGMKFHSGRLIEKTHYIAILSPKEECSLYSRSIGGRLIL